MEKLRQSHGVTLRWRSFELRPPGAPPLPPAYLARIEASRPALYAMAKEQYDLELNVGRLGTSSRLALVGAKIAEEQGVGHAYHDAVFRAFWQEARDIGLPEVLGEIASSVGLSETAFRGALGLQAYLDQVLRDVEQARAYGLSAVPALVLNNKYLVTGARPYRDLCGAVERISGEG